MQQVGDILKEQGYRKAPPFFYGDFILLMDFTMLKMVINAIMSIVVSVRYRRFSTLISEEKRIIVGKAII